MSDSPLPSVAVFVVFAIIGLAVVLSIFLALAERLEPLFERWLGGVTPAQWCGDMVRRFRKHRRRGARRGARRSEDDDDDDELDEAMLSLLSILPSASLIVDRNDDVITANPQAYRLGIMQDDRIVDEQVLAAVREVRDNGGRRLFDVQTTTAQRFVDLNDSHSEDALSVRGVRRPNWLKVTVGRIDERFVVVMLDDVSESVRFAQIRDAFIVNVSEQLLVPTQALDRLADELERDDLDTARIRATAREVRSTSGHLNHMMSDLLLLIKAQEPITPSMANRINVVEQLDYVVEQVQSPDVRVMVRGDRDLIVNGDAEQIRTAVTKLVENAVQYSPQGGCVSVSVGRDKTGANAVIRVIDQGKGIAKAEQSRIFERFYRGADQSTRSADGVGLGLAIVKHVALTHHGTAAVWSCLGQGSTFSLTLPLAR